MKQTLKPLVGAYNGLAQKIAFARSMSQESVFHPEVRRFAEQAVGRGPRSLQAKRLFRVLKEGINYVADPVGLEYTKAPWVMLSEMKERGFAAGDCDDQATLAYTLLNAVGIPARLRVAWYGAENPQHIYAVALIDNQWVPFDTTSRFGAEQSATKFKDFS